MALTRIEGGLILTMDKKRSVLDGGCLIIRDNRIEEIHPSSSGIPLQPGETLIDARDKIILPGLINTHMHQRPMRGIADGFNLRVWHDIYVDEVSDLMVPDDSYAGALAGCGEALKGGVTTVMSSSIFPLDEARAAREIGIRARLVAHVIHDDEADHYFELLKAQAGSEEDRVRLWVGLEAATVSTSRTRRKARQLANDLGLRIHTHFSEGKRESVETLIADGFLGPDVHMAHCIQVTPEDIDLLAEHRVGVAHCPTSNLKLGNGVAPVPAMRAKGIAVGIATDGIIATGRIDLFEQMRLAGLIQRGVHRNPRLLPPQDLLAMVTCEAARVIGMEESIGSLEVGKKADVTIFNTDRIWLTPRVHTEQISNIMELTVWSASTADVDTVLVDGQVVLRNWNLVTQDERWIRSRVQKAGSRILEDSHFERRKVREI